MLLKPAGIRQWASEDSALCRTVTDRFNPKRIIQMGAGGTLLVLVTITLMVVLSTPSLYSNKFVLPPPLPRWYKPQTF